ncbi:AMP-binding protein [Flavobacterium crassostreae]|uniref:O-succinylbenzoic acid--CoA ligase n=1 Tax=Flavobacterium crassostreae TaxID=1763534 RepID=A0A1B9E9P6_9FLAO|nr:AMP-binding protein [Flavobacterium crassostreae]OCB78662.1 O-succinylbenzoic acid--CoA ligase [Flavobacterium crassostreae]
MTNQTTYHEVHTSFKLNGLQLDKNELRRVAYSLIKEGDATEKAMGDFILDWFDNKHYIELQTSGTTGAPKRIRMEKQKMVNSALATAAFFELHPGDKALCCLPATYIAGKMMLVRSFVLGLEMDLVVPNATPLAHNKKHYDFVAMVPLQVQNSLEGLDKVKKLIIGGTKVSSDLEKKLVNLKNTSVYETYGMTETITHIAAKKIGEKALRVLPGVQISQNESNCLVITAPKISDQPISTQDVVTLLDDKQFVFLGRADNLVNSGGIKLIPEQIEAKLAAVLHSKFFVAGIADPILGEKLVLVIEGKKQKINTAIFDVLDKYEIPKEILFVAKFLETENGKLKRKQTIESL